MKATNRRCPLCAWEDTVLVDATAEYSHHCRHCDVRFNEIGEIERPAKNEGEDE